MLQIVLGGQSEQFRYVIIRAPFDFDEVDETNLIRQWN